MATTQQPDDLIVPGIPGEAIDFSVGSTSHVISNLNVDAMIEKLLSYKQTGKQVRQQLLVLINTYYIDHVG